MRLWNAHKIPTDRVMFSFFHAAAETGLCTVELAGGDTAGVPLPRAGYVVSVTARADITGVAGGGVADILIGFDGGNVSTSVSFDSNGAAQVKTGVVSLLAERRFFAEQEMTVLVGFLNTITVDDLTVTVEVELER